MDLAKSILRESELYVPPPLNIRGYPPQSYLSRDHACASSRNTAIDRCVYIS